MSTPTRKEAAAGHVLKLKNPKALTPVPFEYLRTFRPGAWLQVKVRGGAKMYLLLITPKENVDLVCWDPFAKSDNKRIVQIEPDAVITTFNQFGVDDARITDHRAVRFDVPTPLRNPLPWV